MGLKTKWYAMDVNEDRAEISIFDEIGGFGVSVAEFKNAFDLVRDKASIKVLLNSYGGDVCEGMALYNILSTVREKVSVEVYGVAASIASIIALAGKELVIYEGAYFMIHNPWTITWGDGDQLRHDAEILDKMRGELVNIYKGHSNLTTKQIGDLMDNETWMTADEAKENGFATRVQKTAKMAAKAFDYSAIGFKHTPKMLAAPKKADEVTTIRDFENLLRDAGFNQAEATALSSAGFKGLKRGDRAAPDIVKALKDARLRLVG